VDGDGLSGTSQMKQVIPVTAVNGRTPAVLSHSGYKILIYIYVIAY